MAFLAPSGCSFVSSRTIQWVLVSTYAKLDWNREVFAASLLLDSITTIYTGEEDEGWLNDAALALGGLEDLLGEALRLSAWIKLCGLLSQTGNRRMP